MICKNPLHYERMFLVTKVLQCLSHIQSIKFLNNSCEKFVYNLFTFASYCHTQTRLVEMME